MSRTHAERTWESYATHGELRKKAIRCYPMTKKRYRVEGSPFGNSQMLTRFYAHEARSLYGGKVVEVWQFMPAAIRNAEHMIACDFCDAKATEPCKTSGDKIRDPHLVRWEQFNEGARV